MEDLADIKDLWQTAKVSELPNAEEAVRIIKSYRFNMIVKKSLMILLLALMILLLVYVVFYGPKMLTTRIGEAGFFTGIIILFISNTNSLRRASNQINRSNQEFIEYLKQTQRGRIFFYEKVQPIIFLGISLSLLLYAFELVYNNLVLTFVIYSLLIIYMAVMWYIVRPRIIKKRTKQLKETIEKLESLTK